MIHNEIKTYRNLVIASPLFLLYMHSFAGFYFQLSMGVHIHFRVVQAQASAFSCSFPTLDSNFKTYRVAQSASVEALYHMYNF